MKQHGEYLVVTRCFAVVRDALEKVVEGVVAEPAVGDALADHVAIVRVQLLSRCST